MAAGECDIWIQRVKLPRKRPRPGIGGLSMSRTEVSFTPCNYGALSGVQLRGQNCRRSRDRRPRRMPESEQADDSDLEYTSPLPPWCTSGQYWPSSDGPVYRASSRWVSCFLAFVTLGPPMQGLYHRHRDDGTARLRLQVRRCLVIIHRVRVIGCPPGFAAVDESATISAVTTGGSAIRALLDNDAVRWSGPPFSEARYGTSSLTSSAGRFAPPSDPDGAATFPPWLEGYHSARYKFAKASFPQGRGMLSLRTPGAGLATCLSLPNVGYSPRAPHAVRYRREPGGGSGEGGSVYEDLAYNVPRKLESFWPESKAMSVRTNGERPGDLTARCMVDGEGCALRVAIEYDGPTARRGGGRVVRKIDVTLLSHESWADGDSFCLASSYSQLNAEQGLQCFYREVMSLRRTGESSVAGKVRVAAFMPRYVRDEKAEATQGNTKRRSPWRSTITGWHLNELTRSQPSDSDQPDRVVWMKVVPLRQKSSWK
ncbi:hypothetical protein THAOC_15405 [Thalassiosira oceanica]|uniref:Uncharacterized protein n=1 Tax=Thalassiosira oceanica TaxID=159749 RepID=K0SS67_THAOC|nr:hypothetical protein THAOC_15405 [Thalassiosira oceanica]|eukprot:EJK63911.1 hypothetical protein THAOC_15405 [Thalassiosira oceanica]